MINLKYDNQGACEAGVFEHPQKVMDKLGISYQLATPQSLYDSWWFWGCVNVPDPLPPYLSKLATTPQKAVGYGLSQEQADMLTPFDMQRYAIDCAAGGEDVWLSVEEDRKGEWVKYDEAVAWGGQKFEDGKAEGFKMAATAPPVAAGSVDTPEFVWPDTNYQLSCDDYEVVNAAISAWGAQQREQGRQEGFAQLQSERESLQNLAIISSQRAEKAEARVKELEAELRIAQSC